MSYVNLLPEDYVARQAQKRTNLLCAVLFGLVMAGVVTAAIVSERAQRRTREVNERVNESYCEADRLTRQLQELESVKGRMVEKASLTARLLERVPRSYLLATVTNALPAGGSLLSFELTTKRVMTTIVTKAKTRYERAARKKRPDVGKLEIRLKVKGLAATDVEVAKFIAQMAKCSLMESVDLVYSEEKEVQDVMVREFQVDMLLKPNADVRDAVGKTKVASADARGEGASP